MQTVAIRMSTGLAGLDAQLSGGIPAGTVHILVAEPMNAQELFGFHFAAAGTTGEGVRFITTNLTPEEVTKGITAVGGAESALQVDALPKGKTWPVGDFAGKSRIIFDSFSTYCLNVGWDVAYESLQKLKAAARKTEGAVLLQVTAELHSKQELTLLKLWADGAMDMGFDRQGFGLYPYLKVTKMRGVPDSARFLLFKETEKGLFMESTRRVF